MKSLNIRIGGLYENTRGDQRLVCMIASKGDPGTEPYVVSYTRPNNNFKHVRDVVLCCSLKAFASWAKMEIAK